MILLAFRFTRHYWRLGIRQLMLPIGLRGESFPYRADFVFENVGHVSGEEGLICGKFDAADFSDARGYPVYVPLRCVGDVRGKVVAGSTVRYFDYRLGPTVDYRGKGWEAFSEGMRMAVLRAINQSSNPDLPESDNVLVIRCDYRFEHLPEQEETDRWIRLTRLLTEPRPYNGVINGDQVRTRLLDVAYVRVTNVSGAGKGVGSITREGRIQVRAARDFAIEAMTSLSPELAYVDPFPYRVSGNSDYFEMIDDTVDVSAGILNHKWLLRCRRMFRGRTDLRLSGEGAKSIFASDIILPVKIGPSLRLWPRVMGLGLLLLGLLIGFVSNLPDGDLRGWVWWWGGVVQNLDAVRWWLRTCAIIFATSGVGTWLLDQRR